MEQEMTREITTIGFILLGLFFITVNIWAYKNPHRLTPLGTLIERLMSDRTMRIAFAIIWWWVGWHFLYSNL